MQFIMSPPLVFGLLELFCSLFGLRWLQGQHKMPGAQYWEITKHLPKLKKGNLIEQGVLGGRGVGGSSPVYFLSPLLKHTKEIKCRCFAKKKKNTIHSKIPACGEMYMEAEGIRDTSSESALW